MRVKDEKYCTESKKKSDEKQENHINQTQIMEKEIMMESLKLEKGKEIARRERGQNKIITEHTKIMSPKIIVMEVVDGAANTDKTKAVTGK